MSLPLSSRYNNNKPYFTVVVVYNDDNKILLIEQPVSQRIAEPTWSFPMGWNCNNPAYTSAQKNVFDETGLHVKIEQNPIKIEKEDRIVFAYVAQARLPLKLRTDYPHQWIRLGDIRSVSMTQSDMQILANLKPLLLFAFGQAERERNKPFRPSNK